MRPLVAHCHRGLASACQAIGAGADADVHGRTAVANYGDLGMTQWAARC